MVAFLCCRCESLDQVFRQLADVNGNKAFLHSATFDLRDLKQRLKCANNAFSFHNSVLYNLSLFGVQVIPVLKAAQLDRNTLYRSLEIVGDIV